MWFLGAAQVDKFGNINTTVIGDYHQPRVRLPGAGGAPEIAGSAKKVLIMLKQGHRTFVEKLAFITSVGHGEGGSPHASRVAGPGAGGDHHRPVHHGAGSGQPRIYRHVAAPGRDPRTGD